MKFLEDLAARRRFGMKPGLETISALCKALGDPQRKFKAIHIAGTNGKGATAALLDAALREVGFKVGRYTSPHLMRINERFCLDGVPVDDETLERIAQNVENSIVHLHLFSPPTFFEALTAVAFLLYAEAKVDFGVLECGLGGRLDATNICDPCLAVITKIGLDHCDWLGATVEKVAAEKAGIVKPGVPVVLGANCPEVRMVVARRAAELGAPFYYAPELASAEELPATLALQGSFNRENAVTALAALKVLQQGESSFELSRALGGWAKVVWPGRFQRVGRFILDGAHNPPAAEALVAALAGDRPRGSCEKIDLIAGFCRDKAVDEVLRILSPMVAKGIAVQTVNPRSLTAEETAAKMQKAGMDAMTAPSLRAALSQSAADRRTLICGSLFLVGEALSALGASPWPDTRFDANEQFVATAGFVI